MELAGVLKNDDALTAIPLVGFFSHVHVELQRRAKEAGFDQTIPRSVLVESFARMLGDSHSSVDNPQ
jgi:hypothetical protein